MREYTHAGISFTTVFVLHGLNNGDEDSLAFTLEGDTLGDGWYYIREGDPDPENIIPFISEQAAIAAAKEYYSFRAMDEVLDDIDVVIKSWVKKGMTRGEILHAIEKKWFDTN